MTPRRLVIPDNIQRSYRQESDETVLTNFSSSRTLRQWGALVASTRLRTVHRSRHRGLTPIVVTKLVVERGRTPMMISHSGWLEYTVEVRHSTGVGQLTAVVDRSRRRGIVMADREATLHAGVTGSAAFDNEQTLYKSQVEMNAARKVSHFRGFGFVYAFNGPSLKVLSRYKTRRLICFHFIVELRFVLLWKKLGIAHVWRFPVVFRNSFEMPVAKYSSKRSRKLSSWWANVKNIVWYFGRKHSLKLRWIFHRIFPSSYVIFPQSTVVRRTCLFVGVRYRDMSVRPYEYAVTLFAADDGYTYYYTLISYYYNIITTLLLYIVAGAEAVQFMLSSIRLLSHTIFSRMYFKSKS